jgi:hypothetical protein
MNLSRFRFQFREELKKIGFGAPLVVSALHAI